MESESPDLLQRFVCGNGNNVSRKSGGEHVEGIELSLGLSLNGKFGVDPQRGKMLIRASSVANFVVSGSKDETTTTAAAAAFFGYGAPITRTFSLPAETDDEWRKRKDLQSKRRLEAKRKRVEKLKNGRVVKEKLEVDRSSEESGRGEVVIDGSRGVEVEGGKVGLGQISSQGSVGSQGSGSSGIFEFESLPIRGTNAHIDERSPASEQSLPEQIRWSSPGATNGYSSNSIRFPQVNGSAKVTVANKDPNVLVRHALANIPCVSTKGDGPDGKKVDGFLYGYKKGEEVKIVCVCHGSSFSPAEFVKHGGGGDVEHPLRHIVISPPSFC